MNLQIPGQPAQQIQIQANPGPRSNSGTDPRLAANTINLSQATIDKMKLRANKSPQIRIKANHVEIVKRINTN